GSQRPLCTPTTQRRTTGCVPSDNRCGAQALFWPQATLQPLNERENTGLFVRDVMNISGDRTTSRGPRLAGRLSTYWPAQGDRGQEALRRQGRLREFCRLARSHAAVRTGGRGSI